MRPKPRVFNWERREIVPPDAVDGKSLGSGNHPIISIQDFAYDERQPLRTAPQICIPNSGEGQSTGDNRSYRASNAEGDVDQTRR